jgi:hypothetical protein
MSNKTPRIVAGISTTAFPLFLFAGFVLHPHLLSPHLTTSAEDLIEKFHGQSAFHAGHLIVFAAVPLIVISLLYVSQVLDGAGRSFAFWGALLGVVGAVVLAGDKGALCIVLSAFDSLPPADFEAIRPAIQAIVERRGLLVIFWLLPLLPLGGIIQIVGMMKEGMMSRPGGIAAIVGLALLNNPDIDIVSSIGALLMCVAYVPLGLRFCRT